MKHLDKYRNLDNTQRKIRLTIMDMIIEKDSTITLSEAEEYLSKKFKLDSGYIKEILNFFIDSNIMVVDDENINFIYPVSAIDTNHKVTLADSRKINAMCAIDAMGVSCTFDQDITINSNCSETGKDINIIIKDGKLDYVNNMDLRVLHINLDKHANWASSC